MPPVSVITIFDVGKTNKKLFLFDAQYQIVHEESVPLPEITDEDGFPCEDVQALTMWIKDAFHRVAALEAFTIKAVNVAAYGASFVYLDEAGTVLTPLYNYLKPYPEPLRRQFYKQYGGEEALSQQTASPALGSLNSGLQLYRLKQEQPGVFEKVRYALHLPQYVSYVLSQQAATDISSVGCHTLLWDFEKVGYHHWVRHEGLDQKFAPLRRGDEITTIVHQGKAISAGIGLHDSSAALIPYLALFPEPFVLISTGTWCISLNPFTETLLTAEELKQDCLCYLTYDGKPVKASRLFAGNEHEEQVKRLAAHFNKGVDFYKTVRPDATFFAPLGEAQRQSAETNAGHPLLFAQRDLAAYASYEAAYHRLIFDIITQQVASTQRVLSGTAAKRLFVDGGFGKNPVYMQLLAAAFPHLQVYAASVPQATALGAALAIRAAWNATPLPHNLIDLKRYSAGRPHMGF